MSMRTPIALLITSWILGISVGALGAPSLVFDLLLVFLSASFFVRIIQSQLSVALLLVFILGYVYGIHADSTRQLLCEVSSSFHGRLSRTYSLTPTQARYVFIRDDGCELLVYAPRFPVLVQGTVADIEGIQETPLEVFSYLPEYAQFLHDEGISLVIQQGIVHVTKQGNAGVDRFRIAVSSRISMLFREPDASIITAMIAGDQGMIPQDIKDIYRNSGITHILSISGLHVSVIAVVLTVVVGLFGASPIARSFSIAGLLWLYIVSVGAPASAVRAGLFWTCYILAYHLQVLVGLLTTILLTLTVLLTISPDIIRSIGFQLSIVAVAGIGVAMFFVRKLSLRPLTQSLLTLVLVSVGATVATAPLTLYYFGNLSLVGVVTNMLVVPLLPLVTYLVLAALLLSLIVPSFALALSFLVHLLMSWILRVATLFAYIPYGHVEGLSLPLWVVGVYYGVLLFLLVAVMHYKKFSWREWWI